MTMSARCSVAALLVALALLAACSPGQPTSKDRTNTGTLSAEGVTVHRTPINRAHPVGDDGTICIGPKRNGECFQQPGRDGWTLAAQDKLSVWVERVYAAVGSQRGFADIGLEFKPRGVVVYFHGALPSKLAALATRAEAEGVRIEPIQARFGARKFEAAANRLGDALDAAHVRWNLIGTNGKWTKIQIGGPVVSVNETVQDRVRRIARDTIGNLPIVFVPDPGADIYSDPIVHVHLPPAPPHN